MARKIKLTLVSSKTPQSERDRRGLKDKEQTGVMVLGPSVGHSFTFWRDNGYRFYSSNVESIDYIDSKTLNINTRNSVYRLDLGEEVAE